MNALVGLYGYVLRAFGVRRVEKEIARHLRRRGRKGTYQAALAEALEIRTLFSAPVVAAISRLGDQVTNQSSVSYLVMFDQAVTGVSTNTFTLTTSGLSGV